MKWIKHIPLLLLSITLLCPAQVQTVDSLRYELAKFGNSARYNRHAVNLLTEISGLLRASSPQMAIEAANEALPTAIRIGYHQGECEALLQRSAAHQSLHSNEEAIVDLKTVLKLAQKHGVAKPEAQSLNRLGSIYRTSGDLQKSREMHTKALQAWKRAGDQDKLAHTHSALALVERELGNFDKALEHYEIAHAMIGRAGDDATLATIQSSIADLAARNGDWDKAAKHSMSALDLYQKLGDQKKALRMHSSMGLYCWRLNRQAQAKRHFVIAKRIGNELGDNTSLLIANINAGRLLEAQEKFDLAEVSYRQAADAAAMTGEKEMLIASLVALARVCIQTGRPHEASAFSDSALVLTKQVHTHLYVTEIALVRTLSGFAMGSFAEAFTTMAEYAATQDSMRKREKVEKLNELEITYHLQLKERENALLIKNQELKEIEYLHQADEMELLLRDKQLQAAELARSETVIELQKRKAVLAKRELVVLAQKRQVQEMELERQRMLFGWAASGGLALAIIAVLAVFMYRQKTRSAAEQTYKAIQLAEANTQILEHQRELEERSDDLQSALVKLEQRNDLLLELDKEKSEFLAIAAHDLKNPIGLIHGLADLLKGSEYDPEFMQTSLEHILHASNRMLLLISNLLDIDRIESGGLEITCEEVGVQSIVDETIALNMPLAREKDIRINSDVQLDSIQVIGDASSLQQVLDNFISNAVKFSPHGSTVTVSADCGATHVLLLVKDQGPGIGEEEQEHLFKKFSRLTPQPTGGEVSTGLGLYIVERLATAMGGTVSCSSTLGEGSTFTIELPLSAEFSIEPLELVYI